MPLCYEVPILLLHELQSRFADGILGEFAPDLTAHVIAGKVPTSITVDARLEIYRNNVFSNYRNALCDSYPVILRLLGAPLFQHAADTYIRSHPSVSGDLAEYGGDFADFLAGFEACAELLYLPDVARLEWAWDQAFHAADQPPPEPPLHSRLQAMPPEQYPALCFKLHPSCRLLASAYPILKIWQVNQADYSGDQAVDLGEGGVRLLVSRSADFTVAIMPLAAGDYAFLQAIIRERNLEEALETGLAADSEFNLGVAMEKFIAHESIVDFA